MEKNIETAPEEMTGDKLKKLMGAKVDEFTSKMAASGVNHSLYKITMPGPLDDNLAITVGAYVDVLEERGYTIKSHTVFSTLLPDGNCFTTTCLLVKRGSIIPATRLIS